MTLKGATPKEISELSWEELQASLRQLERRDWWLWAVTVVVMLLLTAAVVAVALPTLLNLKSISLDAVDELNIALGVRGLVGLVLLFNTYSIYQQILIQRLRRRLAEQIAVSASSHLRAEDLHRQLLEKQKRDKALVHSIDTLTKIVDAATLLNSTIDFNELINTALQLASRQTCADRGTLFLADRQRQELWSFVGLGLAQEEIRIPMSAGIAGHVSRTGETVNLADAYEDPRFDAEVDRRLGYRTRSLLCLPILNKGGSVVGVLQLLNKASGPFDAEDVSFLRALSVHCAIAIENAQLHQLAMHDSLTGLHNRRFIEEYMAVEFERSDRHEYALTLLILDLNNFKEINDRHGHAAGDMVLREFANQLKKACRGCDVAARIGGDEFILLLPECPAGQAPVVLARLSGLNVDWSGAKIPVTFAAGWAEHQPGEKPAELLNRADQNLYAEKRSGKLEEGIRQAQKMETMGQLTGGVAHDLSNLLMVIKSYSELALDEKEMGESQRKNLQEIQKASGQATALTRQLLAFSRKQPLAPEILSLNTEIGEVHGILARLLPAHIRVQTKLDPELGHTKADRSQVEQIILNLAVNARDAMADGGTITIETANVDLDEAFASTHPGARKGAYVVLRVRDTGSGMNAETKARAFEPFFTTKEGGKGTGLGLATVYGIVKQSAGYIWVDSEPGKGSTFSVYLPRVAP